MYICNLLNQNQIEVFNFEADICQYLVSTDELKIVEDWHDEATWESDTYQIGDDKIVIHGTPSVDLHGHGKQKDGRQEGCLHGKGHQAPVHVSASREEILWSHFLAVLETDEDSYESWHDQEHYQDEVVCPVESNYTCHLTKAAFAWDDNEKKSFFGLT